MSWIERAKDAEAEAEATRREEEDVGPRTPTAEELQDDAMTGARQDPWKALPNLAQRLATALAEIQRLKSCSTIEMMCENPNVDSHVREWEARCLAAEAEVERLREFIDAGDREAVRVHEAHLRDNDALRQRAEAAEAQIAEFYSEAQEDADGDTMSKLPSYYEIENEGVIERLSVEIDRLRHAHNGEVCVDVQEAYDEMKRRVATAEACRSCKGTGQATGRISCVCGGSGKEDDAHERLIDRSFDYDVLRDKLAAAQQREAWWREYLNVIVSDSVYPSRADELRRLLGLDQEGDR